MYSINFATQDVREIGRYEVEVLGMCHGVCIVRLCRSPQTINRGHVTRIQKGLLRKEAEHPRWYTKDELFINGM